MGRKPSTKVTYPGARFGMLTVLEYVGGSKWLCRCDCGSTSKHTRSNLASGGSRSCGCRRGGPTHGLSRSPEYRSWRAMLDRCYNPNTADYRHYGGRGISVFQKWKRSFSAFYAAVGQRPSSSHSLDRINNNGNYEPGNVRWATKRQQNLNKRTNPTMVVGGEPKPVWLVADECGVPAGVICSRIKAGWPTEKLTLPLNSFRMKNQKARRNAPRRARL